VGIIVKWVIVLKQTKAFDLIRRELTALESCLVHANYSQVELVNDIGSYLLKAGGKRLRPALYFLCARGGCKDLGEIMPIAEAIEMIHMATLVHDDILDNAAVRRGAPSANVLWGDSVAVLSGDYLFAQAFSLVATVSNTQALKVLTHIICEICEGEILQAGDKFNVYTTEEDYLNKTAKKTAGFIAASCRLGAIAAAADTADIDALSEYGYAVGMAFQLMDDILDVTASMEQIGKPVGNDLQQGVITLPVIYALKTSPRRDELKKLIQSCSMSSINVKRGLAIINDTEAVDYSCHQVNQYLKIARDNIPHSLAADTREALIEVTNLVVASIPAKAVELFATDTRRNEIVG